MTIAINEILKQVEFLSPAERDELAAKLAEQVRPHNGATAHNGSVAQTLEAEPLAQSDTEAEDEDWLDVFRLNHIPPKWTYTVEAQFYDGGRGKPMPYDLSDIFPEEEETGGE